MTNKLRNEMAKELLDILIMKRTPNCLEIDCELKARISKERPWPFEDVEDAANHFRQVAQGSRKYAAISVQTNKAILRLTNNSSL